MLPKLSEFVASLAIASGSGEEKARQLAAFAEAKTAESAGAWQAVRMRGTDESYVFAGRQGEVIVITVAGAVYRGRITACRPTKGGMEVDYSKLDKP